MTINLSMPTQKELKPRICVFGVGGAGGNAVNNMIGKKLEGVEFVVANTDAQALHSAVATTRVQMGVKVTEGLGAGAHPAVGAAAAEESLDEIIDHLAGANMCFITAGMGGGTGTGAAPIIAQAARELGVLTIGVVTKPFQFEGAKRMRQAEEGVEALQQVVDTLIIIPNQNLFRLANENTTFTEAFSMADDVLYQGVKGVTDLMVRPGLINLDFADVRAVMDEMGKAMMGTGEAEGENRAKEAAEKAIANPLLDEISLRGAKGVLINITGGQDLTLFELDEAANSVRDEVDPDANIIVGSTLDDTMEGTMRVSVVATGIDIGDSRQRDIPVPRRGVAKKPLSVRVADDIEEESAEENVRPAAAREAAEVEQPTEGEPESDARTFFDDVEDTPRSELVGDEESDGLLRPPYQPETDAETDPGPRGKDEEPAAPRPRAPGEPTPEALDRLRRAVGRRAAPVVLDKKPAAAEQEARSPRFGINSLINRMTASDEQQSPPRSDPRTLHAVPPTDETEEKIAIPAFLRRQAN